MKLHCPTALVGRDWADDVLIEGDDQGRITAVTAGVAAPADARRAAGPVVPGMPNLHSHAFQRAMAGLAERAGDNAADSFWTWRETMYGFLRQLGPDEVEAIAAQLYVEMLKGGYTGVAEFHYLHHDRDGRPYADRAELSGRILAAARGAGIRLTHQPVLYAHAGFGGQPPAEGQRRFINDVDGIRAIMAAVAAAAKDDPLVRVGLALHSLRAVTPDELDAAIAGLDAPIHIHIAEQTKEVDDCLAWCGKRPVELLTGITALDPRWCLIHATHMTPAETETVARSGAVAGLCLTTEANLGDGIFPAPGYLAAGGRFGVGSDSHIGVSASEELRLMEYGQRLALRQRNRLRLDGPSIGAGLYRAAARGGAQACGIGGGEIAVGQPADLVVLDGENPKLVERRGDLILDSYVFAGDNSLVRDVIVGGRLVVEQGRHRDEAGILGRYRAAMKKLSG